MTGAPFPLNAVANAGAQEGGFYAQTEALAKVWQQADELTRTYLGEMHLHFEGEIARTQAQGADAHNVAYTLHAHVDEATARLAKTRNGRKIKCAKGCSACCRVHVSITDGEAQLLLIAAAQQRVPIDWARVERQSAHKLATWGEQSPGDRRCVFLGEQGDCRVYEHRPAACRKYFVASDPRNCDTIKRPGAQIMAVVSPEAEVIASAMLARMPWGSMPRMLLQARAQIEGDQQ